MQIIDSNIVLAFVKKEEIQESIAKDIIWNEKQNIIFDFILSEIYTVLLIRTSYEKAIETIQWITEDPLFEIKVATPDEIIETLSFLKKNNTKLSFIDAQLLIIAKQRNLPLQTFDKLLEKYSAL